MATDFAKIGFGVDTSQLEEGVAALNTFNSSAKSANSTAKSIGAAMSSSSKVFAAAVSAMSKSIASLVSVTKGASVEQIAAANEASDFADMVYRAAKAENTLAGSIEKTTNALKKQLTPMQKIINNLTGAGSSVGFTAKESKKNFKDLMTKEEYRNAIGVSSRGLTEAQQLSRFNTGNIAAQFQDIAVTAAMGMNPMTIALQQGSQLVGTLNYMDKPLTSIVQAFKSLFNTTSLVTIGLTGLVAAGLQMVDWTSVAQSGLNGLASAMDFVANNADSFASVLMGVVAIIGVIKFESIKTGLMAVASTATTVFKTLTSWSKLVAIFNNVKKSIAELNIVIWATKNPVKAVTAAVLAGVTAWAAYSESGRKAINSVIGYTLAGAYSIAGAMEAGFKSIYKGKKAFSDLKNDLSEIAGKDYVGAIEDIVESSMKTASEAMKKWSKGLLETDEKTNKLKESWEKLQNQVNQDLASTQLEMRLIGADTYTAEYEKIKASLTNQAIDAGISLTPEKIAYIKESADSLARMREETEKANDVFNTSKSITNSFFQDMRTGLRDGASAWESFGNAVTNVLDRILSKMMDVGVDYMFNAIFGPENMAGQSSGWNPATSAPSAKPVMAANGGVFSNGVYSSPTLFKFAKGGKFGVMGEAGPEAVMPLRRGRDGSLGVRADGFGGNDVVVNVYNNSNAQASVNQRQTSQGTEIDVMIDQLVADKMSQPGTSSNNALTAFNNRRLITR